MLNETPWVLIAKYLSGECNQKERLQLEGWLENAENYKVFKEIEDSWKNQQADAHTGQYNIDKGLDRLSRRIGLNLNQPGVEEPIQIKVERNTEVPKKRTWLIAASVSSVLVLFALISLYFFYLQSPVSYVEKLSGVHEKITVDLPDGSTVWLNQNSSIAYPEKFKEKERVVYLKGEAFFEVVPNKTKPFIVKSQGISTRVLGTSFNVKAYEEDTLAEVTLATGRVAVNKEGKGFSEKIAELTPLHQVSLDRQTGVSYIDTVSMLSIAAWRNDLLVFRNNSMKEIFNNLEKLYQVDIKVDNKALLDCNMMISFDIQTDLKEILRLLSLSNSFRYEFNEKTREVSIFGGGCN